MIRKDLHLSKVFIALGNTDMRKSINGLSLLVEENFKENLFSGNLFGVSFLAYLFSVIVEEIWSKSFIGQTTGFASG